MRGNIGQQWRTPLRFAWFLIMINKHVTVLYCYTSGCSSQNKILLFMHIGLNMLSRRMHCVYKTKLVNNGRGHSLLNLYMSANLMRKLSCLFERINQPTEVILWSATSSQDFLRVDFRGTIGRSPFIANWAQCKWTREGTVKLCMLCCYIAFTPREERRSLCSYKQLQQPIFVHLQTPC